MYHRFFGIFGSRQQQTLDTQIGIRAFDAATPLFRFMRRPTTFVWHKRAHLEKWRRRRRIRQEKVDRVKKRGTVEGLERDRRIKVAHRSVITLSATMRRPTTFWHKRNLKKMEAQKEN